MNIYYVYQYLREDQTPYYIGKGKGQRAYTKQGHTVNLPPQERISIIKDNMTDEEAIAFEIELIAKYGRKDLGTGILRNMTDGGDGASGRLVSEETRQKHSQSSAGKVQTQETKDKRADALRGQTRTEEQRKRQSEAAKRRWSNVDPDAEEARRAKLREARAKQVITTVEVTCPHCGKVGGNRIMPRYHFDNCKSRK